MKFLLVFTILSLVFSIFTLLSIHYGSHKLLINHKSLDLELIQFHNYLKIFNKSYDEMEFNERLKNFKNSLAEIARLNALEGSTVFGLTKFSDMSKQEFTRGMSVQRDCYSVNRTCGSEPLPRNDSYTPKKFDWRDHGCESPVQNQKRCAGCWAFSIIGLMECMAVQQGISKERFSVQELLDCVEPANGCLRGRVSMALTYMCYNELKVTTEEEYPLTLKRKEPDSCKRNLLDHGISLREYRFQCDANEDYMLRQIANLGPLVTVINGAPLQNYLGGIVRRACVRNELTAYHAIQIVGYDKTGPIPYYTLKNSYGEDFGENGYVRLAIYNNVCGIKEEIAFLDVKQ